MREIVHTLPSTAQAAILEELDGAELPAVTSSVTRPPSAYCPAPAPRVRYMRY